MLLRLEAYDKRIQTAKLEDAFVSTRLLFLIFFIAFIELIISLILVINVVNMSMMLSVVALLCFKLNYLHYNRRSR